jgi:hypothetical protein
MHFTLDNSDKPAEMSNIGAVLIRISLVLEK